VAELGFNLLAMCGRKLLMKRYRFFFHYNRGKRAMSVHFRGVCYIVDNVTCDQVCETKWNRYQPYLVMQGFAYGVDIQDRKARIW